VVPFYQSIDTVTKQTTLCFQDGKPYLNIAVSGMADVSEK
jgi:hypothetical protein